MPSPTLPVLGAVAPERRWWLLALIGLAGGFLSGVFGIGGGVLMVPMLVALARMDQRCASVTSLAAIVPTSIAGSLGYLARGEVNMLAGLFIAVGAVGGAFIGTALLSRFSVVALRWMFIALLLIVAARMLLVIPQRTADVQVDMWVALAALGLGLFIGTASGLFGIGGGAIAVPALVLLFGTSDLVAKGTSMLIMVPTSVAGTIGNAVHRRVDYPSVIAVGMTATIATFGGIAVAVWMSPQLSNILFTAIMLLAISQLIVQAIRLQQKPRGRAL